MNLQQIFSERLLALLEEKGLSQGDFAKRLGCSRQSINFYILGKRSPDIVLAAKMAQLLGVSCDYLIGFSDFRSAQDANLTANQIGLTEDTTHFFAGLKIASAGLRQEEAHADSDYALYSMHHARETLNLLNRFISHDRFGVTLQYIKKYRDFCHGKDTLSILNHIFLELTSPETEIEYGSSEEQKRLIEEFYLHIISKYLEQIVREIAE